MGLPREDQAERDQLERWVHGLKGRVPGGPEFTPEAIEADRGIRDYFINLLQDRRSSPRDDVISTIVHATINGVPFTEEHIEPAAEVMGLMMILFLGGVESTAGLIGTMFKLLAEHPDQRRLLLDDPSLIPQAVEETVRWATPLQLTARTVMRDVTLHGVTIPERSRVVLVVGAANRDERQFPDADRFDVTRGVVKHVGFGEGVHGCLGRRSRGSRRRSSCRRRCRSWASTSSTATPSSTPAPPTCTSGGTSPSGSPRPEDGDPHGCFRSRHAPRAGAARPHLRDDRRQGVRGGRAGRGQAHRRRWRRHARPAGGGRAPAAGLGAGRPRRSHPRRRRADAPVLAVRRPGGPLHLPAGRPARRRTAAAAPSTSTTASPRAMSSAIRGPRNNFPLVPAQRYLFIAGGIGVTPLLPMVAAAEAAGADWRLHYGGHALAAMAFTDELAAYRDRVSMHAEGRRRPHGPRRDPRHARTRHRRLLLRPGATDRRRRGPLQGMAQGRAPRGALRRQAASTRTQSTPSSRWSCAGATSP